MSISTGILTQSDELHKEVTAASEVSGEKFWRLPFEESYWESMKSGVADMLNTGAPQGGAITAALFLKQVFMCVKTFSLLCSLAYLHYDYGIKVEHCAAATCP
jgi:leucyl aminopeptidase